MRVAVFQHVPFEGPALVGEWARQRGHAVEVTRWDLGEAGPAAEDVDLLAVMGGPMSVGDTAEHTWLTEEKLCLGEIIAAGRPVLGICLGAQLLAESLGARVFPNAEKEIGWFPCQRQPGAARSALLSDLPETFPAFHWHGDTFQLPARACHIASSAATANQAFEVDGRLLGLQFHWDYTAESIEDMLEHCGADLDGGDYVQSPEEMRTASSRLALTRRLLMGTLDALAATID
jgi:GMP synthase-like glutamine amidotransferase